MKTLAALRRIRPAEIRKAIIEFFGGWDQTTPPLSLPSGFVRSSENYECDVNGGYSRTLGYERHDGQPSPSAATYSIIDITLIGVIAVGNTVTGVTSAATAVVIAMENGKIAVTKIVGTFVSYEVLNVAAVAQATTTSSAILEGASTRLLHAQYRNLAADQYRADILAPTGVGSSTGGVRFNGVTYTWKNNAGGTGADLWKSSATGWQQVTLFNEVSFTAGGTTEPAEGATLTQGANTALIKRVVRTSGSFAAGTAAGRLIVSTPAPGNFGAGAATVGAITLTLSGIQSAITFSVNGRYKFVIANFGGSPNTNRVYGVNGVDRGFEFDGTVVVPISTGMATDTPTLVYVHELQLFYAFGGSAQHSAPGTPYVWSVLIGASEIGMGDTVTGFMTQPGSESAGALAIFARNRTSILYGTGVANWKLISYRSELGAYTYTIQSAGVTMFLDDQGVTTFTTAQTFGNFAHAAVTERIKPWLNILRSKAVESCVVRDKSQYRLFFNDGHALYVTFAGNKIIGSMPILFPTIVTWVWSSEEPDGTETIYFGSINGMVYQMDKGTSFDGDDIWHHLYLAWDFLKSPRTLKRFQDCTLEVSGPGYAAFNFGYSLGYGSSEVSQPIEQSATTNFSAFKFDAGYFFDSGLVFDGNTLMPSVVTMDGEGENVSLSFKGTSDFHESIKISAAVVHFSPRRELR